MKTYEQLRPEEFREVYVLPDAPSFVGQRRPDLIQAEMALEEYLSRSEINALRSESLCFYILGMDAAQLAGELRDHLAWNGKVLDMEEERP